MKDHTQRSSRSSLSADPRRSHPKVGIKSGRNDGIYNAPRGEKSATSASDTSNGGVAHVSSRSSPL